MERTGEEGSDTHQHTYMGCSTSVPTQAHSTATLPTAIMSATAAAAAALPPHVHHPNADHNTTFQGFAAYEKGGRLSTLSYNPPKLGPEWVEIAVSHCGICGSDVGGIDSELMPTPYPCIMGHEIIGRVAAIGSEVKNIKVGDRVGLGAQCHACFDKKGNCPECRSGWVQYCRNELTFSIHSTYPPGTDAAGQVTQGGWADRVRCSSRFVFPIPASIPSAEAAPLLCGGITVFAPLQRYVVRPGMRVGVVGIGGLGHMALLMASKMHGGDVHVTAISHNAKKAADSIKFGAHAYVDTSDAAAVKAAFRSLDFVLVTANGKSLDFASWLSMVSFGGTLCTVGLTAAPFQVHPFSLGSHVKLVTSSIGTLKEIEEMFAFVDQHQIKPAVQCMDMAQVNEGVELVRKGEAKYRVVLENKVNK